MHDEEYLKDKTINRLENWKFCLRNDYFIRKKQIGYILRINQYIKKHFYMNENKN